MAESSNPPEMIIVLGSHTNNDGSPTDMMKSRVDRAAELYASLKQQNIDCCVIVTGYQRPEQVMESCQPMTELFLHWLLTEQTGKNEHKSLLIFCQFF